MSKLFLVSAFAVLCGVSFAQDLDTTTVTDTLDSGLRGNATGTIPASFNASKDDGTEFEDYIGADNTSTTGIRYINTFAGASGGDGTNGETPVVDVTAAHEQPDHDVAIAAIPANSRPVTSGDPTKAVLVSDDGGYNALFFGDNGVRNYYVEVDVYCKDKSSEGTSVFEMAQVGIRGGRDSDPTNPDFSYNLDRAGSYALTYDYQLREIKAVRWTIGNTFQDVQTRVASTFTNLLPPITNVVEGWHTFKIDANGSFVEFWLDGVLLGQVNDGTLTYGRPGLQYRERNVTNTSERPGTFDNLRAGPSNIFVPSAAEDWVLFQ